MKKVFPKINGNTTHPSRYLSNGCITPRPVSRSPSPSRMYNRVKTNFIDSEEVSRKNTESRLNSLRGESPDIIESNLDFTGLKNDTLNSLLVEFEMERSYL